MNHGDEGCGGLTVILNQSSIDRACSLKEAEIGWVQSGSTQPLSKCNVNCNQTTLSSSGNYIDAVMQQDKNSKPFGTHHHKREPHWYGPIHFDGKPSLPGNGQGNSPVQGKSWLLGTILCLSSQQEPQTVQYDSTRLLTLGYQDKWRDLGILGHLWHLNNRSCLLASQGILLD